MGSNLSQSSENNSFTSDDLKISKTSSDEFGILLIAHGSSLPYAEETFKEIANKYIAKTGHNTEVGYMKVAEPSISEAINILTSRNSAIKKIIAMPVFLAPGIHTNIDIPIILGLNPKETDPRCPDGNYPDDHYLNQTNPISFTGEIDLIECIGPDSIIIDIINKRVKEVLIESEKDIDPEKTAVLLVSHGSRLNYNREFINNIYKQYKNQTNFHVGQGFMELCEPTISQGIDNIAKETDFDRLIVVPVFLAPGVHTNRDIPSILGILERDEKDETSETGETDKTDDSHSHDHSTHSHHHHDHSHSHDHDHSHGHGDDVDFDGEILYTEPLGADDLIIDIIKERVESKID